MQGEFVMKVLLNSVMFLVLVAMVNNGHSLVPLPSQPGRSLGLQKYGRVRTLVLR